MSQKQPSSSFTGLRLSPSEMSELQKCAKSQNMTISAYIRNIIFARNSLTKSTINDASIAHNLLLSARAVRADFKRIAQDYHSVCTQISGLFSSENDAKNLSALTLLSRDINGLMTMTLELQSSLNRFLEFSKVKETHATSKHDIPVPKTTSPTPTPVVAEPIDNTITFYNMQNIELIGNLMADAKETKGDRVMFSVGVDTLKGGEKKRTVYTVFADKTNIFKYLVKGKQVYISGELFADLFEKDGKPSLTMTVSALIVKLCS